MAREPQRLPPGPPLDHLQGVPVLALDPPDVAAVAKVALINASLRLFDNQGALFISYAHRDAWAFAAALDAKLRSRGYRVFRDEQRDRDDIRAIPPGSTTQRVIADNILKQGFVLVIDTPAAEASSWVRIEVDTAFGFLLPLLPVVVGGKEDPPKGGRFRAVRELGREIRLGESALGAASGPEIDAAVDEKIDELETQIVEILLGHLRSRRRLVYGTRRRFEELRFHWADQMRERLLFAVERSKPGPSRRSLTSRMVVQCSPYPRLVRKAVDGLSDCFLARTEDRPFNWAVLVHNAVASIDDLEDALRGRDYIIALRLHEISDEVFN